MFKKQRSIFVFWVCLHICTVALLGQIPKIEDFTIYNHISHQLDRSISGIYQDRYGFIWLTGSENIYRFDGVNFVSILDLKDKNFVFPQIQPGRNDILQDQKERYWFLTPTALVRWDPRQPSHKAWSKYGPVLTDKIPLPTNKMHRIAIDTKGYIWVVFDGQDLYKINPETGQAVQRIDFRIKEPGMRRSEIDAMEYNASDNRIYFGADYLRLIAVNPDNGKIDYPHLPLRSILKKNGMYEELGKEAINDFVKDSTDWWLSLTNNIILRYSFINGTIKLFRTKSKKNKLVVSRIKKGPQGLIWYSDVNDVMQIFDSTTNRMMPLHHDFQKQNDQLGNIIDIYFDKQEVMWLATGKCLAKYDPNEHPFKEFNPYSEIKNTIPYTFYQDKFENEFIGTNKGLLYKLKNQKIYSNAYILPIKKDVVNIVNISFWFKSHYLLGTTKGIYVFDLDSKTIKKLDVKGDNYSMSQYYENPANSLILDTIDTEPVIWLGSNLRFLYKYTTRTKNIKVILPDENDPGAYQHQVIQNIRRTDNGDIWLTTSGGGISKMVDKKNVTFKTWKNNELDPQSIRNNDITDFAVSSKGIFWLPTITGIDIFDQNNFYHIPFGKVTSRHTSAIVNGNKGEFWSVSGNEIVKWSDDGKLLNIYPKGKYNFNSMFFKKSGEIILWESKSDQFTDFTSNKMYIFNSDKTNLSIGKPTTIITRFEVEKSDSSHLLYQSKCNLAYNQNNISFNFSYLSGTLSKSNQFMWKLEGLDENWNESTSQNFTSYASLNPGQYKFRVKSSNAIGSWDQNGDIFAFTISPPYFQTWWFRILSFTVIAYLLWYLIHQRTNNQLALQKAEIQKSMAIEEERKRIARDMHDDLGSGLSAIHLYSEDLKNSLSSKFPDVSSDLDIIVRASWDLNQKVKEIVWSNEIKESTVATLIIFIKKYIDDLRCINHFIIDIDESSSVQHTLLSQLAHKNIYLSLKEIINNAVKHSNATDIVIRIFKTADFKLIIEVKDNGHGFDLESALINGGSGLTNIAARVKEIGGDLEINPDHSGTAIRLSL